MCIHIQQYISIELHHILHQRRNRKRRSSYTICTPCYKTYRTQVLNTVFVWLHQTHLRILPVLRCCRRRLCCVLINSSILLRRPMNFQKDTTTTYSIRCTRNFIHQVARTGAVEQCCRAAQPKNRYSGVCAHMYACLTSYPGLSGSAFRKFAHI